MTALPDADLPADDDRSDDVTVFRRPSEVGYSRTYRLRRGLIWEVAAPNYNYVVMNPPFLVVTSSYPPHKVLTFCQSQWVSRTPLFVEWGVLQLTAAWPSRVVCTRPGLVRVPAWWHTVEVPFGAMVEPPPVLADQVTELMGKDTFAWIVLRSE